MKGCNKFNLTTYNKKFSSVSMKNLYGELGVIYIYTSPIMNFKPLYFNFIGSCSIASSAVFINGGPSGTEGSTVPTQKITAGKNANCNSYIKSPILDYRKILELKCHNKSMWQRYQHSREMEDYSDH